MANEQQINAAVDAILAAFDNDPQLWAKFLARGKLDTELEQIRSAMRNAQAANASNNASHDATMAQLAQNEAAKLAEIDNL